MTPTANSNRTTVRATKGRRPMSRQHKRALAEGREQGRTIRRYLDALAKQKPRRGRRRTVESANRQLRETVDQLATASSLARVELLQRRIDLESEIALLGERGGELPELEAAFVASAKSYSERKGITVQAWLQGGVPRSVLTQAGLTGSRRGGRSPAKRTAKTSARASSRSRRPSPVKRTARTSATASSRSRRPSPSRKAPGGRKRAPARSGRPAAARRGRAATRR
jgi:hypothetical protein